MLLFTQLLALALLQGLTEFLPISSSGHLVLLPHLTGWPDHGLVYDVAAHFGTLIAVVFYFRRDLQTMAVHWSASLTGGPKSPHSTLAWAVLWGTVPVSVIGLLSRDFIAEHFRTPLVIAATTIGFGALLWVADRYGRRQRSLESISWKDIAWVGMAQALALIPGTSRSGVTMTMGLALGLKRAAAARFSFLLSIPVIFLASAYESWQLLQSPLSVDWSGLALVVGVAAVSAFACIAAFMSLLERIGMLPFVLYRFALGAVLIWLFM